MTSTFLLVSACSFLSEMNHLNLIFKADLNILSIAERKENTFQFPESKKSPVLRPGGTVRSMPAAVLERELKNCL